MLSVQDIVKASVCLVVVAQWSQFSGRSSVVVALAVQAMSPRFKFWKMLASRYLLFSEIRHFGT